MPGHKKLSFLVIDESPEAIAATTRTLSPYHCVTAMNREDAVKQYQTSRPDITLLEISSQAIGFETLQKIREIDPDAFVVIVTTSRSDKDVQASMQAGATGYILKPFLPHHVIECAEEHQLHARKKTKKTEDKVLET